MLSDDPTRLIIHEYRDLRAAEGGRKAEVISAFCAQNCDIDMKLRG
jgi:hypothetical protein